MLPILVMYTIIGFGVFLSGLLERERFIWCFVAGIFWPVVLYRIVYLRWTGSN